MNTRKMEQLLDLLSELSREEWVEGETRDAIGQMRFAIEEHMES